MKGCVVKVGWRGRNWDSIFILNLLDWVISNSLSWAYSKHNLLWQLLIYLHLDRLLEDEWKRSWVALLPSVEAAFRSIQQQVLVRKTSGSLMNRQLFYLQSLTFNLVFPHSSHTCYVGFSSSCQSNEALSKWGRVLEGRKVCGRIN